MNIKYLISKNLTWAQIQNRKTLRRYITTLNGNILDLGCGNGEYSLLLAKNTNNHITSLEADATLYRHFSQLVQKQKISNIKVQQGDAHHLPFKDQIFDAVFCNTVLEHVQDAQKVIQEIQRVLNPQGKVIISIPFLQEIHADPDDYIRYTPFGLRKVMEKYGFTVETVEGDYGALQSLEYLTLGSIVWRVRESKNPLSYIYVAFLLVFFCILKLATLLFYPFQKFDKHFLTMVILLGKK